MNHKSQEELHCKKRMDCFLALLLNSLFHAYAILKLEKNLQTKNWVEIKCCKIEADEYLQPNADTVA